MKPKKPEKKYKKCRSCGKSKPLDEFVNCWECDHYGNHSAVIAEKDSKIITLKSCMKLDGDTCRAKDRKIKELQVELAHLKAKRLTVDEIETMLWKENVHLATWININRLAQAIHNAMEKKEE